MFVYKIYILEIHDIKKWEIKKKKKTECYDYPNIAKVRVEKGIHETTEKKFLMSCLQ